MYCVKYLTMTFPAGLPAKIGNPVPTSQVRFQQFRAIERFCAEGINKCSDRGEVIVMIYKLLLTVVLERSLVIFG